MLHKSKKIEKGDLYNLLEQINKHKLLKRLDVSDSMWSKYKAISGDHRDSFFDKLEDLADFLLEQKTRAIQESDLPKTMLIEDTQDAICTWVARKFGNGLYIPQETSKQIKYALFILQDFIDACEGEKEI